MESKKLFINQSISSNNKNINGSTIDNSIIIDCKISGEITLKNCIIFNSVMYNINIDESTIYSSDLITNVNLYLTNLYNCSFSKIFIPIKFDSSYVYNNNIKTNGIESIELNNKNNIYITIHQLIDPITNVIVPHIAYRKFFEYIEDNLNKRNILIKRYNKIINKIESIYNMNNIININPFINPFKIQYKKLPLIEKLYFYKNIQHNELYQQNPDIRNSINEYISARLSYENLDILEILDLCTEINMNEK